MNLKYSTSYPHGQENRQDNKSIKNSSRRGRARTADHQAGRQHQHPRLAA